MVTVLRRVAALLPVAAFLAVYLPRVGHGFILDDYRWVLESRIATASDLVALFTQNNGFYRPMVALTFGIDHALAGIEPFWYGVMNVALALVCAVLIYGLARSFTFPWGAAALTASLWLLNFHGVNMAVLWISGRTALLLTFGACGAAIGIVRRKMVLAAVCTAVALLSKEEAVVLPFIFLTWIYVLNRDDPGRRRRMLWSWSVVSAVLLAIYFVLRTSSGAIVPTTAPSYYRFTFEPLAVLRNVLEYADRTFTLPTIVIGLAWLILRWPHQHDGAPLAVRREIVVSGAVWIVGAYALTLFLPVRSSLYVCFPLVTSCLIAAELCRAFWAAAPERSRRVALQVAIVLTLIAAPIHFSRTHRLVDQAEVSQALWHALPNLTRDVADGATVVIEDDMTRRANVRSAFGNLSAPAYELLTGRRLNFWFEPPLDGAGSTPCPTCIARRLRFRDGSLAILPSKASES